MGNGSFLDGVLKGIEKGYFKSEISDAAYQFQKRVESEEYIIVGVNKYVDTDDVVEVPEFRVDPELEREQIAFLQKVREERDNLAVEKALNMLIEAAKDNSRNLIPYIIDALRVYASVGEIIGSLKKVYGEYREPIIL
jgi:methylmalonyl-CoA mutase N-terminal domain/subunit